MYRLFLSLLLICYTSLLADEKEGIFVLVSDKELTEILEKRLKGNSYVDDIVVDDKIYPGLPIQKYSSFDKRVAIVFTAKNLSNMSERAKALGVFECMKKNDLLTKEVKVDYMKF